MELTLELKLGLVVEDASPSILVMFVRNECIFLMDGWMDGWMDG